MTERRIVLRSHGRHTQEQQPEKTYLSSLHEWITQVLLFYCFRPIFNEHVIFIATDEHGITRHVRVVPCLSDAITTPCVSDVTAAGQGFTSLQNMSIKLFHSQNACVHLHTYLFCSFAFVVKQQSFCGHVIFIATDCHGISRHIRAVPCISDALTTPCVSDATVAGQGFTLLQSIPVNVFRSQNACVHSHTYLYCFFRFIRC